MRNFLIEHLLPTLSHRNRSLRQKDGMTCCSELPLRNPFSRAQISGINRTRSWDPQPSHRSEVSSSVRHVPRGVYLTVRQVCPFALVVQIMQCVRLHVSGIRWKDVGV